MLNENQQEILKTIQEHNTDLIVNHKEAELLESLKMIARPMFETLLTDVSVKITEKGDKFTFKVESNPIIEEIMSKVVNIFSELMTSYEYLNSGNEDVY